MKIRIHQGSNQEKIWAGPAPRMMSLAAGVLLGFMLFSCQESREDPNPPDPPVWVLKSAPEAWVEQGIDADSRGGGAIVLMWYPNGEADLAGYELFRADTALSGPYEKRFTVDLFEPLLDTIFFDDEVDHYVAYYYYLLAFDLAGNRSRPSDTISYTLLNAPVPYTPVNDTVAVGDLRFEWMDRPAHFVYSNEFVLRLERVLGPQTMEAVWICRFNNDCYECGNTRPQGIDYFSAGAPWPGNVTVCVEQSATLPPGQYRWKVKAIGEVDNHTNLDESSGESEWAYFILE